MKITVAHLLGTIKAPPGGGTGHRRISPRLSTFSTISLCDNDVRACPEPRRPSVRVHVRRSFPSGDTTGPLRPSDSVTGVIPACRLKNLIARANLEGGVRKFSEVFVSQKDRTRIAAISRDVENATVALTGCWTLCEKWIFCSLTP